MYGVTEILPEPEFRKFKSLGGEFFNYLTDAKVYLYDKYGIYLAPYKNIP
jgi:hypothetical protein